MSLSPSLSIHFKFSSPNGAQLATCNSPVRATRPTGRRDCSLSPSLAPRARRLASQIAFPPQLVSPSLSRGDFKQVYNHLVLSERGKQLAENVNKKNETLFHLCHYFFLCLSCLLSPSSLSTLLHASRTRSETGL